MRLIHYSSKLFDLEPIEYKLDEVWRAKPSGLWVSVEGEYDWKRWCEAEDFYLENLAAPYEVVLKENASILYLKTPGAVLGLKNQYPFIRPEWDNPEGRRICGSYEIDWEKMMERYQGIIIAPYHTELNRHRDCCWYSGWDCASGCIWDLSAIESFNLIAAP